MTDERAMKNFMAQSLEAQEAYNAELGNAFTALSDLVFMMYRLRSDHMITKVSAQGFVTSFAAQAQEFVTSVTRAAALLYEAQTLAIQAIAEMERNESNGDTNR